MKAMILAAGLGTRLKPWTEHHPKALVPVNGIPMLERVIVSLKGQGFDQILVNVHHFSSQIVDFLKSKDFGMDIMVSDESGLLLDTGGGIVKASGQLDLENGPVLVHNVDILSNADLKELMEAHTANGADATLLVSDRESSRKLIVGEDMALRGWHNLGNGQRRPDSFTGKPGDREYAFSGIHVVGAGAVEEMRRIIREEAFPIMDYYLSEARKGKVTCHVQPGLRLIDIGKPATLEAANLMLGQP